MAASQHQICRQCGGDFRSHPRSQGRFQRRARVLAALLCPDVPMMRLAACALLVVPLGAAADKAMKPAGADDALPKMLWHEPRQVSLQDWICGPGGCDRTPKEPFQFLREDARGTNPKVTVKDSAGRTWSVKFGAEVIPECFASRFVTALGYLAEPTYFVPEGKIVGIEKLQRAHNFVKKDGTFRKGRFEMR